MASPTPSTRTPAGRPPRSEAPHAGPAPPPRRPRPQPWALALALAVPLALVYLIVAPPVADLAAATYRSDLFARAGLTLRDSGWYAVHGHWLPGYSLLAPALGALLGVRALLALAAVAAAALFGLIAERAFAPTAARIAAGWFALGVCIGLLSGRVPYYLGLAIGLGALLAMMRRRRAVAAALAMTTSLASPVAGAFLALAGAAMALTAVLCEGEGMRSQSTRDGMVLVAAAAGPILALSIAFPEGGWEPFAPSAFWPALGGVLAFALVLGAGSGARAPQPPGATLLAGASAPPLPTHRARTTLRVGAALYALALIGAFVVHTPVGGNAARLGALFAAPLLAGALWESRRGVLYALVPALLYWQLVTPIRDVRTIAGDPSVKASYYAPLRAELRRLTGGRRTIVEVPLTGAHWEAAYLAGHEGIALARGWERQLDTRYAPLFYRQGLSAGAYRSWLRANRVAYVALPDARLDHAGKAEGRLIAAGLPYLREVWDSPHWRLYAQAR